MVAASDAQLEQLAAGLDRSCRQSGADPQQWTAAFAKDLHVVWESLRSDERPDLVAPIMVDTGASRSRLDQRGRRRVGGKLATGVMVCCAQRALFTGITGLLRQERLSFFVTYDTVVEVSEIAYHARNQDLLGLDLRADRHWGLIFGAEADQSTDRTLLQGRLEGCIEPEWGPTDCDGAGLAPQQASTCPRCGASHINLIGWEIDTRPTPSQVSVPKSSARHEDPDRPRGWHRDPFGRHESRWWDGRRWTEHVGDSGARGLDPPG